MKFAQTQKDRITLVLFLVGVAALAVAATAPGVFAAGPATSPPAPRSVLTDPAQCEQARTLLDELPTLWSDAVTIGDPNYALALRLDAGETLSGQEDLSLYSETERLDLALEALMGKIQAIDALIPAGDALIGHGSNLDLTVVHLKAGIAVEPIGNLRRRLLNVSMAALLSCDIGPGMEACQSRKLLNVYIRQGGTGRYGEVYVREDKYAEFKEQGSQSLTSYADYVRARLCL